MAAQYKKPSALNAVSITLLLGVVLAGYVGWSLWPVFALNANVKNELEDAVARLYKLNLLPEPTPTEGTARLQEELVKELRALGVDDPNLKVTLERSKETVSAEARYAVTASFKLIGSERVFHMSPRVETSAARVEW